MNESDRDGKDGTGPPGGEEAALGRRLQALGARIEARRGTDRKPEPPQSSSVGAGLGMAMRLAAEFVAGIVVGGAIGWGIDTWLGTSPWGLIGFVLLGFAAGALNAMREAGVAGAPPGRQDRGDGGD